LSPAPPGPAGGAYSAPPDPLTAFDGLTSNREEERGREERGGKGGKGREREGWGGKRREDAMHPPMENS